MKRPMTPRGYNALREEVKKLKASRPELAKAIEIARAHGDLSENADYDAAKEKSGMVEARIRDMEGKISEADVIDPRKVTNKDKVLFGFSVKLEDLDSGEEKTIHIVGAEESDVAKGWISFDSPMGKAVIGKELGDVAKLKLPGREREYEIMEVFLDYKE